MKVSTINSRGKVKIFKKKGALKFHNDNNPSFYARKITSRGM